MCLALAAFLVTVGIAWLTPLAFSGFRNDQSLSRFWLLLSDSGTAWGVGPVSLLASGLVAARQATAWDRVRKGLIIFVGFPFIIIAMAAFNELVIKPLVGVSRPFVLRLETEQLFTAADFYTLPTRKERSEFLEKKLAVNKDKPVVQSLDPAIRAHWSALTGFSFPSGHSLVAFLFAVMLAFLIQHLVPRGWRFSWIPFLWAAGICLSRVAVGAHSPLDITVGALIGGTTGCLLLWTGLFYHVLPSVSLKH